jgi:hypothetical protein
MQTEIWWSSIDCCFVADRMKFLSTSCIHLFSLEWNKASHLASFPCFDKLKNDLGDHIDFCVSVHLSVYLPQLLRLWGLPYTLCVSLLTLIFALPYSVYIPPNICLEGYEIALLSAYLRISTKRFVFYAVRVIWKESRWSVLARTSCNFIDQVGHH